MSYQDELTAHLSRYKHTTLKISEPGIYNYRGQDVARDHILPLENVELNLLPIARELEPGFRRTFPNISRHRYFHHLNSSQAFAFNLFLPFFSDKADGAGALLRALGQTEELKDWTLEAVPDEREGTNLDAMWTTTDGTTTFCEVKLSEGEFGTAANDTHHQKKFDEIYRPRLAGRVDPGLLQYCAFFEAYQILRNVWHLTGQESSRLLFLLPRANTGLWDTLPPVIAQVAPDLRNRVDIVAIEDLLERLAADAKCPTALRAYTAELAAKYVPLKATGNLGRITPSRKNGTETFMKGGVSAAFGLSDFWGWSASDIVSNATRGRLAEYIVAKALGINTSGVRDEWAAYDLLTPKGTKVEVKSAAYLQTWNQAKESLITFSVRKTRPWDSETNLQGSEPIRSADVYVFALLHHKDKATVNPLDLDQWSFWVVSTRDLNARERSQYSITLASLEKMANKVGYSGLADAVAAAG